MIVHPNMKAVPRDNVEPGELVVVLHHRVALTGIVVPALRAGSSRKAFVSLTPGNNFHLRESPFQEVDNVLSFGSDWVIAPEIEGQAGTADGRILERPGTLSFGWSEAPVLTIHKEGGIETIAFLDLANFTVTSALQSYGALVFTRWKIWTSAEARERGDKWIADFGETEAA